MQEKRGRTQKDKGPSAKTAILLILLGGFMLDISHITRRLDLSVKDPAKVANLLISEPGDALGIT